MHISPSLLPIALLGFAVMLAGGVIIRQHPRLGMVLWLLTVAFVPVWMGVTIKLYFMPATLVGIVVVVFATRKGISRFGLADLLVAAFMISCLAPVITGGATRTTIFVVLANWLLSFVLGRLIAASVGLGWLYGAIAVVFTLVAIGLLIEFLSGWNPFVTLMRRANNLYTIWGTIQQRGDVARAEGAFGHSIAAGSAVAMAIPIALGSRFRPWLRIAMVLIMGAGVVVTLSRVSMLAAGLGIALGTFMLRDLTRKLRITLLITFGLLAAGLSRFVMEVLRKAGDEAAQSASYRGWLLELLSGLSLLGFSPLATRATDGRLFFGNFKSIDSQLLYTGLQYGWIPVLLGILGLLGVLFVVFRRRTTVATMAVAAQIPALATVALITQYADFFWFIAGVATFSQMATREASLPQTDVEQQLEKPVLAISRAQRTEPPSRVA